MPKPRLRLVRGRALNTTLNPNVRVERFARFETLIRPMTPDARHWLHSTFEETIEFGGAVWVRYSLGTVQLMCEAEGLTVEVVR